MSFHNFADIMIFRFRFRNTKLSVNVFLNCMIFIKRSDVLTCTTRNSQKLQIPPLKSATGQRSFYYGTVKIWNTLDPSLKLSKTLQELKRKLKNFLTSWTEQRNLIM